MQLLACYDVQTNDKLELFFDPEDLKVPRECELEFTDYAKEPKKWAIPSGIIHFFALLSTYAIYICLLIFFSLFVFASIHFFDDFCFFQLNHSCASMFFQ
jgi:hypothetical protein